MALRITNPAVIAKVDRLAKATGLSTTAVVECAIDRFARETEVRPADRGWQAARMAALLAQLDRIPDLPGALASTEWDRCGLPK
jgi:antitoxin VapB